MENVRLGQEEGFDVVVVGTGLSNAILAAACACSGRTVLHVDANRHYGGMGAALSLKEMHEWAEGGEAPGGRGEGRAADHDPRSEWPVELRDAAVVRLRPSAKGDGWTPAAVFADQTLPSERGKGEEEVGNDDEREEKAGEEEEEEEEEAEEVEEEDRQGKEKDKEEEEQQQDKTAPDPPKATTPLQDLLAQSRAFTLDLHPRLMYSRGPLVSLLVQSDVAKYVEFRTADDLLLYSPGEGGAVRVPVSKSEVFLDKSLDMAEKRSLMKLTRALVHDPRRSVTASVEGEAARLGEAADVPFREFLEARGTSSRLSDLLCYAVALLPRSQAEAGGACSTAEAAARMRVFLESLGRYGAGSFLFPMYGSSELPQAFCRLGAVRGGVYVLRFAPSALLVDEASGECRGIVTEAGEAIKAGFVVLESQYAVPAGDDDADDNDDDADDEPPAFSRAVAVTDCAIAPARGDALGATATLVFPPGTVAGNVHPVHAVQLDHTMGACPRGTHVVHFSAPHAAGAVEDLAGAVSAVLDTSSLPAHPAAPGGEGGAGGRPRALWVSYLSHRRRRQRLSRVASAGRVFVTDEPEPCGVGFAKDVERARAAFERMFPGEPFLPAAEKPATKATYFEDDPDGLGSLSSDEDDEEDGGGKAEEAERGDEEQARQEAEEDEQGDPLDDLSDDGSEADEQ